MAAAQPTPATLAPASSRAAGAKRLRSAGTPPRPIITLERLRLKLDPSGFAGGLAVIICVLGSHLSPVGAALADGLDGPPSVLKPCLEGRPACSSPAKFCTCTDDSGSKTLKLQPGAVTGSHDHVHGCWVHFARGFVGFVRVGPAGTGLHRAPVGPRGIGTASPSPADRYGCAAMVGGTEEPVRGERSDAAECHGRDSRSHRQACLCDSCRGIS